MHTRECTGDLWFNPDYCQGAIERFEMSVTTEQMRYALAAMKRALVDTPSWYQSLENNNEDMYELLKHYAGLATLGAEQRRVQVNHLNFKRRSGDNQVISRRQIYPGFYLKWTWVEPRARADRSFLLVTNSIPFPFAFHHLVSAIEKYDSLSIGRCLVQKTLTISWYEFLPPDTGLNHLCHYEMPETHAS